MAERRPPPRKTERRFIAERRKRRSGPALVPPSQTALLEAAFSLAKELSLERREEELVANFVNTLGRLLHGRLICLRVVDPRSLILTSLAANGPIQDKLREDPLTVKRSAARHTHLPEAIVQSGRVRIADAHVPTFRDAVAGFSVPLVASGELFGMLNVEYSADHAATSGTVGLERTQTADERAVIPLANQLSVALRNLDLLAETRYYRDYLTQMIDVANALIVVVDREGKVAVMNATMQRFLQHPLEQLVGLSLEEVKEALKAPEPRLATLLKDGLSGHEYSDREVSIGRADGSAAWGVFNTSVLRKPDGTIDGVIAIGQDRERVRQLERQVIQAEKLATLGQLAAGVVHELNNPLTSISVYGDYLVRQLELGVPGDVDRARKIVEGANRIQKLTRDLISYARPSGEFELVEVNDVVRTALVFCEHVIKGADAQVATELSDGLPRVRVITTQLHQVLINLVTNACHALPTGGERLCMRTRLSERGDVLIEVEDSGVGIHELDRAHIFDPFFTTKRDGKGTGLGLSIVRNIIEAHQGQVAFESRPGEGTTFFVHLPAAAPAVPDELSLIMENETE
jgi:PAS domain S-box-containing protein